MRFTYDPTIGATFPQLATGVADVSDLPIEWGSSDATARLEADARRILTDVAEADLPPIKAWRAAFAQMGLKPTQNRCASEALLRRLRKEAALPRLHPFVDLCNAVSAAYAVPVAAFDLDPASGALTVRPAIGEEVYLSFSGETETPAAGEIIFADDAGAAHARRWTNRQSAASAISDRTRTALIVIEGLHDEATTAVCAAHDALAETATAEGAVVRAGLLSAGAGAFRYLETRG